ncbi:hypothetical protein [Tenacibaculum aquimarinum]|uniref:hypothetical protein n=1 Tax=Tenacibaculum aquimarinum TaxID=2910675 RepID=UPI001F0B4060|nr:hypothetical protein [Tenacibaculum aquimarinum]MCH3885061.1 hypothetical protein [Tenacibaculum aquimarinum]
MKIKVGKETLRITKNEYNRFWNPLGMFWNVTEVNIENEWYWCGIKYFKKNNDNYIQILNPRIVNKHTSVIEKFHTEGIYKEIKISNFKINLLKYLSNEHKINRFSYKIRKNISERRNTVYVFAIAIILSGIYYTLNELNNNQLLNYIAENNWIQTIIIFLTISSFINIFYPFTLKKQIEKNDIEKISKDVLEEEKQNEEIRKRASF